MVALNWEVKLSWLSHPENRDFASLPEVGTRAGLKGLGKHTAW